MCSGEVVWVTGSEFRIMLWPKSGLKLKASMPPWGLSNPFAKSPNVLLWSEVVSFQVSKPLVDAGTIIADGNNPLIIDTGANAITNSGTMQSTGAGGLVINSDIANSGLLWADGGNITVHGNVSGRELPVSEMAGAGDRVVDVGQGSVCRGAGDDVLAVVRQDDVTATLQCDVGDQEFGGVAG